MRVALVHDWLDTPGGGELVLARLMRLFPDADAYTLVDYLAPAERAQIGLRDTTPTRLQRWPLSRRWFRAAAVVFPQLIERIDVSRYDLVVSDSHAIAKGVRTRPGQVHVCYCHTPARFAWDLADIYERSGPLGMPFAGLAGRRILDRFRRWDRGRAQAVTHYVANSRHVAALIRSCYEREAIIVHPPVEWDRFSAGSGPVQRGIHYVTLTRLVPYKRIDLLLEAFRAMPNRELRVIGDGPERRKLEAGAPSNVRLLGRLADTEAAKEISSSRAFFHVAKEDFGIATVEAQGAGIPVIGYGVGGTAEIVSGLDSTTPTGVLFAEQTAEAIVAAVERFEANASRITPQACRDNARRFAPARFDAEFLDALRGWGIVQSDAATPPHALVQ